MAKEIRRVAAEADVASIIDRGAEVDNQIKNLEPEDKILRRKVSEAASGQMADGETSLRMAGKKASALVSGSEKITLNTSAHEFQAVQDAAKSGLLRGVLQRNLTLLVPPAEITAAVEVLRKNGLNAAATETISLVTDEWKRLGGNPPEGASEDEKKAFSALAECVSRDVTFRVKYEFSGKAE